MKSTHLLMHAAKSATIYHKILLYLYSTHYPLSWPFKTHQTKITDTHEECTILRRPSSFSLHMANELFNLIENAVNII